MCGCQALQNALRQAVEQSRRRAAASMATHPRRGCCWCTARSAPPPPPPPRQLSPGQRSSQRLRSRGSSASAQVGADRRAGEAVQAATVKLKGLSTHLRQGSRQQGRAGSAIKSHTGEQTAPGCPCPAAGPCSALARATHTCSRGGERERKGQEAHGMSNASCVVPDPQIDLGRCRDGAAGSDQASHSVDAHFLARHTAAATSAPLASSAAMAEARLHPVPCVLPVLQAGGPHRVVGR